jgi:hypothetical protein
VVSDIVEDNGFFIFRGKKSKKNSQHKRKEVSFNGWPEMV